MRLGTRCESGPGATRSGLVCGTTHGTAARGQEEPFSRLTWAVQCDESLLYLQMVSAHSCSNFGQKIQNGVPADSFSHKFGSSCTKPFLSYIYLS